MNNNTSDSAPQPHVPATDPLAVLKTIFTDFPETARERGRITEADTRANILDRIFHEVLLWPRTSVKREPYANPGFVDYLVIHGNAVLLAEAKASDVAFQLPFKKKRARRVRLDGADLSDSEIQSAIRQAQRYASDCGARYAIATNGYTFIVFRALVDGTSWHLGEALLFEDLKDLIEHFVEFHNLLAWDSIVSGSLDREFKLQHTSPRASFRPLDNVISADATYGRNPFSTHLKHYVEKFFGDIAGQDTLDVLRKCYVPSEPIQVIDEHLKLVLQDNLPAFAFGRSEAAAKEHNEVAFNNDVFFAKG